MFKGHRRMEGVCWEGSHQKALVSERFGLVTLSGRGFFRDLFLGQPEGCGGLHQLFRRAVWTQNRSFCLVVHLPWVIWTWSSLKPVRLFSKPSFPTQLSLIIYFVNMNITLLWGISSGIYFHEDGEHFSEFRDLSPMRGLPLPCLCMAVPYFVHLPVLTEVRFVLLYTRTMSMLFPWLWSACHDISLHLGTRIACFLKALPRCGNEPFEWASEHSSRVIGGIWDVIWAPKISSLANGHGGSCTSGALGIGFTFLLSKDESVWGSRYTGIIFPTLCQTQTHFVLPN